MTLLGFNFHWFLSPFFLYGVCYPAVPAKIKIRLLSFPIVIKLILIKTVFIVLRTTLISLKNNVVVFQQFINSYQIYILAT